MSDTDRKLHFLCRCCHSEGDLRNFNKTYFNPFGKESFTDEIFESLNIQMLEEPILMQYISCTICDDCTHRLKEVINFRSQVMICEERFKKMIDEINVQKSLGLDVDVSNYLCSLQVKVGKQESEDEETPVSISKQLHIELDLKLEEDREEISVTKEEETLRDDSPLRDTASPASELESLPSPEPPIELEPEVATKKRKPRPPRPSRSKKKKALIETENKEATKQEAEKEANDADTSTKKSKQAPKFRVKEEDFTTDGAEYFCKKCEKRFHRWDVLRRHLKIKHYKIPCFTCKICSKGFMTQAQWTKHKLEVHNIDERYKCNACKSTFNMKTNLRNHINNFHMMGTKYKCEFCDYETYSSKCLTRHRDKHKTVKDFHCKFCKKSFLRKQTLKLHERIHTDDRRSVCKVCEKAFVQKASLNYHMVKSHPEVHF